MYPESGDEALSAVLRASRRKMPADLAASILSTVERRAARRPITAWPRRWVPAMGFAAAGLLAVVWVWEKAARPAAEIPIESLLAAHEGDSFLGDL